MLIIWVCKHSDFKYEKKHDWGAAYIKQFLTLPPMGYRICGSHGEGASETPPFEIKEGVISDPMLLYSIFYLVYLVVTCKKSARNFKIWARFQDFKILQNGDFALPWQMKNWHNLLDFEDTGLKFYMQAYFKKIIF